MQINTLTRQLIAAFWMESSGPLFVPRLLVLPDHLHLRGHHLPLHVLRLLLEGTGQDAQSGGGREIVTEREV